MLTARRCITDTKLSAAGSKASPAATIMRRKVPARAFRSAAGGNLSTGRAPDHRQASRRERVPEGRRGPTTRFEEGGRYIGIPRDERFPPGDEGQRRTSWT
jgi:hypothetical protein